MRQFTNLFKSLAFTAILSGLALAAAPALALQMPGYPSTSQDTAQNYPISANKSYNWAGYTASGNNFSSVSGTWTVPTVSASASASADATWVGIGGVTSQDLIQAGTQAIVQNGQTQYQAWLETLPQTSQTVPLNVKAGDSITVTVSTQQSGQWLIYINNNSTGQNYQTTVQYNSSLSSAEWVEEMPVGNTGFIPLDNFGGVNFSNATTVENGQTLTAVQAGAQAMNMLNSSNQNLADASALGSDGTSFGVTRTSASAADLGAPGISGLGRGGYHRRGRGLSGFRPIVVWRFAE